jgi:large subunit ribosomal protein L21
MADTYAIIESGGKQYRAEKGTTLVVDRLKADEGAKVSLRAVMFRGDDVVLESEKLEKVKVEATVTGHERGEKIRVFKYKAKKGYRKRAGHRSELTRLEVTEVKMLTRKPAAAPSKDEAEKKDEAAKGEAAEKPAAKTTAAKKPAAPKKPAPTKKPAAKKPAAAAKPAAAKKPAAKKPAARKPAAKKPAAKPSDEKEG